MAWCAARVPAPARVILGFGLVVIAVMVAVLALVS
jgi:hypothetical protein